MYVTKDNPKDVNPKQIFQIIKASVYIAIYAVLWIRDLGSGAFLTPGSGIRDPEMVFSESQISDPKPIVLRA
jgi:hypothetical protein